MPHRGSWPICPRASPTMRARACPHPPRSTTMCAPLSPKAFSPRPNAFCPRHPRLRHCHRSIRPAVPKWLSSSPRLHPIPPRPMRPHAGLQQRPAQRPLRPSCRRRGCAHPQRGRPQGRHRPPSEACDGQRVPARGVPPHLSRDHRSRRQGRPHAQDRPAARGLPTAAPGKPHPRVARPGGGQEPQAHPLRLMLDDEWAQGALASRPHPTEDVAQHPS